MTFTIFIFMWFVLVNLVLCWMIYGLKGFSDVMKRLEIKLAGDELYEEFQRIYDESVGRDAGKDKAEDKMWNRGRGR